MAVCGVVQCALCGGRRTSGGVEVDHDGGNVNLQQRGIPREVVAQLQLRVPDLLGEEAAGPVPPVLVETQRHQGREVRVGLALRLGLHERREGARRAAPKGLGALEPEAQWGLQRVDKDTPARAQESTRGQSTKGSLLSLVRCGAV